MAGLAVMRRAGVEADVPWLWGQGSLAVAVKKTQEMRWALVVVVK